MQFVLGLLGMVRSAASVTTEPELDILASHSTYKFSQRAAGSSSRKTRLYESSDDENVEWYSTSLDKILMRVPDALAMEDGW